ncbi:MAG: PD-(D/E)XK nuclease family protein [Lutibacter sp.]
MSLEKLQYFLDNNVIPKIKRKPKTFLGIAKQPHYENVWSNIYAFFFNINEVHGLKDLFISSLIECIDNAIANNNEQNKEPKSKIIKDFSEFESFDINTEFRTNKNGRIDLLLHNENAAIIIENKVYHHLNNDLDDYWGSVELDTDSALSKVGVILSLQPISVDNYSGYKFSDEYLSITHLQLMECVIKKLGPYLIHANQTHVVFLQDFYQNVVNLSQPTMSKENINFYFENKEKINELVKFKSQYKRHIISEVETACNKMYKVQLVAPRSGAYNSERLRYYQSTVQSDLCYTIVFEDLLKGGNQLKIIIELIGKALKNGKAFDTIMFDKEEVKLISDTFYSETNKKWAHFASETYLLNKENLLTLGDFIQDKIENDHFKAIFNKLEDYLTKNPIQ